MAKRRLSDRQKNRIQAAQHEEATSSAHQQAVIVSHQGGRVQVEFADGLCVDSKIKSNLGNIVCGDRVAIENTDNGEHRVVAIMPRDNLLQRIDGFGHNRAVAANITQLIVCLSVSPEPNLFLLDQYLLSAEQQGIEACIVLNKADLYAPTGINHDDPFGLRRIYQPMGYEIIYTSVTGDIGMNQLIGILANQVSVLSGVSGVGKSSLTKWLLPEEEIKIASISEANEEGRHTTRTSRLYHLAAGGDLIDTPGVRGFNPFIDEQFPPAHGFRDISSFADGCRFNNCLHRIEPACAVLKALSEGYIADSRYQNYLKILEQSNVA